VVKVSPVVDRRGLAAPSSRTSTRFRSLVIVGPSGLDRRRPRRVMQKFLKTLRGTIIAEIDGIVEDVLDSGIKLKIVWCGGG